MAEVWDDLDALTDDERDALFRETTETIREDVTTLAERLEAAGWRFYSDAVIRPDDLRQHDVEALAFAEELLGHPLPGFLRQFALDVGVLLLSGYAEEGTEIARAIPALTDEEGVAAYAPLTMVPLPNGIDELEMAIEDEFDALGVPIVEDPLTAAGISGGPPLCLIFEPDQQSTDLYVDFEPEAGAGIDLVRYIRQCLTQGGFFDAKEDPYLIELGRGLGAF